MITHKGKYYQVKRIAFVSALVFFLSGCSVFSIFYNYLPSYLLGELNDIATLSDEQDEQIKPIFEDILLWHRQERLPQYIKWIDEYKDRMNKGFDTADVIWVENLFKSEFALFFDKVIKETAYLATEITAEQIDELQQYFDEKNEEHEDIFEMEKEEYYEDIEETSIEKLETWIGDLTAQQVELVKESASKTKDLRGQYLEYRQSKQQQWIALLKDRIKGGKDYTLPLSEFEQKMKKLARREPDKNNPDSYLSANAYNKMLSKEAIVTSLKIMTSEQKEYLFEEVNAYREKFVDLLD